MREDRRRIPVGLTLLCLALGTPLLADESAWTPPETPENPLKSTELGQGSYPDPSSGTDRKYWRRNLFKRVGSDQKFLITTWWPAEFRRIGFTVPLAASVIGATQGGQGSSSADHQLSSGFGHWGSGEQKGAHEFLTQIGDRRAVAALIGSSYLISRWAGNERIERTASLTGEALINTTIYVGVLKRVSKRARPNDHGGGEFFISSPMEHEETDSFPSGHAAGAFAMAAVIAGEFHERRWVSVVA
ncbi:MAG: phosphatase PAP2 family protein, partial [Acidobacteriota bacterium]|nr:phosphatase PAP2 family protein [Acidobacteriota bacterium]